MAGNEGTVVQNDEKHDDDDDETSTTSLTTTSSSSKTTATRTETATTTLTSRTASSGDYYHTTEMPSDGAVSRRIHDQDRNSRRKQGVQKSRYTKMIFVPKVAYGAAAGLFLYTISGGACQFADQYTSNFTGEVWPLQALLKDPRTPTKTEETGLTFQTFWILVVSGSILAVAGTVTFCLHQCKIQNQIRRLRKMTDLATTDSKRVTLHKAIESAIDEARFAHYCELLEEATNMHPKVPADQKLSNAAPKITHKAVPAKKETDTPPQQPQNNALPAKGNLAVENENMIRTNL